MGQVIFEVRVGELPKLAESIIALITLVAIAGVVEGLGIDECTDGCCIPIEDWLGGSFFVEGWGWG